MRKLAAIALSAAALFGIFTPTADAYTNGAAPQMVSFTCNNDGTVTLTWSKTAGKPTDYTLSRTNPTPISSLRDRIPGSRVSKGSLTVASGYVSPGYVIEASVITRGNVYSNVLSATCP